MSKHNGILHHIEIASTLSDNAHQMQLISDLNDFLTFNKENFDPMPTND